MKKQLLLAFAVTVCSLVMHGNEIKFSYNTGQNTPTAYGFDKAELYDVAIRIDEPSLQGAEITGLRVPLPADGISDASGWLSTELTLKRNGGKNVNAPDICTASGQIENGYLRVTFDQPYTISGPLYAGYSFTVNELTDANSKPVSVTECAKADVFWLHSSKSRLKWTAVPDMASVLEVNISGNINDNAAVISACEPLRCSLEDETVTLPVNVVNHGLNPVSSLNYTYTVGTVSGSGRITLDTPLEAVWGISAPVNITLENIPDAGAYTFDITVTEVNGSTNTDAAPMVSIPLVVYPFLPVNRPLVEEYTGLWCGYCPKGFVALETMKERYPDRFIGVAYHSGDDMATASTWPNHPDGFPAGYINRTKTELGDIYNTWGNYANPLPPAGVDVKINYTDADKTKLKATATARFIENEANTDYGFAYLLVADGLSDPDWVQSNNYSGTQQTDDMPGYWGKIFCEGQQKIKGLTFNDVVIETFELDGVERSIPAQVNVGEKYSHNCVFDLTALENPAIVQDKDKLRVVAVLMNRKTKKPVNCNTSLHADGSYHVGMTEVVVNKADVVATMWYNMQGIQIPTPQAGDGIVIRIDRLSNGTFKSTKHMF